MAIDFFDCNCVTITSKKIFGIYDVPPAALDFTNDKIWIAWVENDHEIEVTFTAIDKCINIPWGEGERCEGMITYKDALIFVELKDADGGKWPGKARSQLINTIRLFKRDASIAAYARHYGHIANKQRPNFKAGGKNFSQQFEDATGGFVLRVSDVIIIE